jgi:aryl-alcohol dehydrogenase-like predicted oxidoreductase
MEYRELGRTGFKVSSLSFGAWAIGGTWGPVVEAESLSALRRAVEMGVNFFDTADVYGDGISEKLIAKLKKESKEEIIVATKAGRRLNPHVASGYNRQNLTTFVERSLKNLRLKRLTWCSCTVRLQKSIISLRFSTSWTTWLKQARYSIMG